MSLIGQTAGETVSRMHATIGRSINLKVTPQQGHPQQITALTFCRSLASSGATPLPRVTLAVNQQDKLYGRRILRLGFIYRGQSRPRSASIRHAFGVQFVFSSRLLRALAEQV